MKRLARCVVALLAALAVWAWWAGRSGPAMSLFLGAVLVGILAAVPGKGMFTREGIIMLCLAVGMPLLALLLALVLAPLVGPLGPR